MRLVWSLPRARCAASLYLSPTVTVAWRLLPIPSPRRGGALGRHLARHRVHHVLGRDDLRISTAVTLTPTLCHLVGLVRS